MTKVEELRFNILVMVKAYEAKTCGDNGGAEAEVDSLIAAATEEGCDEGWAVSKMLWTRMQQWNDEWREENPKERSLTLLDAIDLVEWKIATARAEGAEQEREKIRKAGNKVDVFEDGAFLVDDIALIKRRYAGDNRHACLVPLALLAPATKEADHGNS